MSVTDELLTNNRSYAGRFDKGDLPLPRRRRLPSWLAWMPASTPPGFSGWRKAMPT